MSNRFDLDDFDQDENFVKEARARDRRDVPPRRRPMHEDSYAEPRRGHSDDWYSAGPMSYEEHYRENRAGISSWVYFLVIFLFGGGALLSYLSNRKPANPPITAPTPRSVVSAWVIPTAAPSQIAIPAIPTAAPNPIPLPSAIPIVPLAPTAMPPTGSSSGGYSVGSIININEATEIRETYEGLTAIQINNHWGFVNSKNVVVIAPVYSSVTNFINNIAVAKIDGHTVMINQAGDIIEQAPDVVVCAIFEIISASLDYKIISLTQVNQYQSFFDSILVAIQTDNWDFITEDQFMSLIEWILDLVVQLIILGWNIGLELIRQIQALS